MPQLLGEVSEEQFEDSNVGKALFVIFMFLVVILLANVLIAIVTDSYKVIQVSSRMQQRYGDLNDHGVSIDAFRTSRIKRLRSYSGQTDWISLPRWMPSPTAHFGGGAALK